MDQDQWVPASVNPWDEIIPNLWQGGTVFGPQLNLCVPEDQFDVVINMAGQGPRLARITNPHPVVFNFYVEDDRLGPVEMTFVVEAVNTALEALEKGMKTLVRCHQGWNRSGLVVGLVLRTLGWAAQEAIDLIRSRRSPHALGNAYFVKYIYDHPGR